MSEPTILVIELTDDELGAVSGGAAVGVFQHNRSRQTIVQRGGNLTIGGGGSTAFAGTVTFTETFTATNTATQTNTNNGTVTGNAVA
jgi:hypothetical protein